MGGGMVEGVFEGGEWGAGVMLPALQDRNGFY